MYYVIGQYSDGLNAILGVYSDLERARSAIRWQTMFPKDAPWTARDKCTTEEYNGTVWTICKPSNLQGVFFSFDGGLPIYTQRGALTAEAYEDITRQAVKEYNDA